MSIGQIKNRHLRRFALVVGFIPLLLLNMIYDALKAAIDVAEVTVEVWRR